MMPGRASFTRGAPRTCRVCTQSLADFGQSLSVRGSAYESGTGVLTRTHGKPVTSIVLQLVVYRLLARLCKWHSHESILRCYNHATPVSFLPLSIDGPEVQVDFYQRRIIHANQKIDSNSGLRTAPF